MVVNNFLFSLRHGMTNFYFYTKKHHRMSDYRRYQATLKSRKCVATQAKSETDPKKGDFLD